MDRNDWAGATADIERARSTVTAAHLSEYGVNAIVSAASARLSLHRNETDHCRAELLRAMRLREIITWANPWAAVWHASRRPPSQAGQVANRRGRFHAVGRRTPTPPLPADPPLAQTDWGPPVRLTKHGGHRSRLDLPETRSVEPQRGSRPSSRPRPPRTERPVADPATRCSPAAWSNSLGWRVCRPPRSSTPVHSE